MATAIATESKYKSFMKPVKFWQRSSHQHKEPTIDDTISKDYSTQQSEEVAEQIEEEAEQQKACKKSSSYMPSFGFGKKVNNNQPATPIVALTESGKTEVYKLSTIDDAGAYIPPSPTLQGKRDHWIDVSEDDIMNFRLPGSECLTTHVGEKHVFFTPSTFVQTQPYISPIISHHHHMSDSTLSTVPSLEDDGSSDIMTSSCRSSASYL